MRLVELTIHHLKENDVGGPIDAAELSSNGSLRWYSRKPNCAKN